MISRDYIQTQTLHDMAGVDEFESADNPYRISFSCTFDGMLLVGKFAGASNAFGHMRGREREGCVWREGARATQPRDAVPTDPTEEKTLHLPHPHRTEVMDKVIERAVCLLHFSKLLGCGTPPVEAVTSSYLLVYLIHVRLRLISPRGCKRDLSHMVSKFYGAV